MELFNIPLFDNDFYKMIFRFAINISFLTVIIRFLYYTSTTKKDYLFTYYMIGTIVFFLCFTLKKYELDIGMALGLFAIFGIIRYRTTSINIKEMTYLFIIIGISVINSLANKKMSYAEIIGANFIILSIIIIIEKVVLLKNEISKEIVYENLENIKVQNYDLLKKDIEDRTGITINKLTVGKINFSSETAQITIYYYK